MIYLDYGATSFHKPDAVHRAVSAAMKLCANPGRGGYCAAMAAAEQVYRCRETAGKLFHCSPEQVVFTSNCTQGLNMAINSLIKPGDRVLISGFEHNAVVRPLYARGITPIVAGRRLFDPEDTRNAWERALQTGVDAAVFTHVSNVFGYVLPVKEMSRLCREYGVPFILDAAQSAGSIPVNLEALGADFIAMPGHKGLLGPQGTGLLLCSRGVKPFLYGGTGNHSQSKEMPEELPERGEAGTLNVPGIAGLEAGMRYLLKNGVERIGRRERAACAMAVEALARQGYRVFAGESQGGTVSVCPPSDCEDVAAALARRGIAVRAGLHCAPLAHESAGTLKTGTLRISFGWDASPWQVQKLVESVIIVNREK